MRSAIVACVLIACGDSAPTRVDAPPQQMIDAAACSPMGTGTVTGSVAGAEIAPVIAARVTTYVGVPTIVLVETAAPNPCGAPMSSPGDYLNMFVCTKAVGSYPMSGSFPTCPGSSGAAVFGVQVQTMTALYKATGGMVTIATVDTACTTGMYSITFDSGDTVSGAFAAHSCP